MSDAASGPPLVLAVNPNPSIDLLFDAHALVWDDANRLPDPRRRAGGQGVNVMRTVAALGGHALPLALLGGAAGAELEAMLAAEGQRIERVPISGATRVFVAVRERETGRSLLLNARGPHCSTEDGERLLRRAESLMDEHRPRWVACCGSVPPGIATDLYARIAGAARARGMRVVVDADGELLSQALEVCDLVVPNEHEASRVLGRDIGSLEAAAAAAVALARGRMAAAVTLGERGAVLSDGDRVWHGVAPKQQAGSAVGAGDAFLGALLLALDAALPPPEALRRAVAAGAAVLQSEGGDLLTGEEVRRQLDLVEVKEAV